MSSFFHYGHNYIEVTKIDSNASPHCFIITSGCKNIILILDFIGERAKRARHSQVCSIENRIYIYMVRATFVLITRKEGGA